MNLIPVIAFMSDRPALNESEAQARHSLAALAESMLAGDISFFEGSAEVLCLKSEVGGIADRDKDFDAFVVIESETDHLPRKAQHHLWNPEVIAKLSPEFERMENGPQRLRQQLVVA